MAYVCVYVYKPYYSTVSGRPNVTVKQIAPLLRILEVPPSNLGSETGYVIEGFRGSTLDLPLNC
jgi:hypothetical protein